MKEIDFKEITGLIAVILALITFLITRYQLWKTGEGAIDRALHGDLEALEKISYKLKNRRWVTRFYWSNTRRDIIHALCLGWSLELPSYVKVLIFDALMDIVKQGNEHFIIKELDNINTKISLYQSNFDTDEFNKRLEQNKILLEKLLYKNPPLL